MDILIAGSIVFIGYHLVNQLLKTDNKIYGCDNLSSLSSETQKIRLSQLKKKKIFDFKKFDLKNYSKFSKYYRPKKIDIVIHLAAQPGVRISQNKPLKTIDQNIKTFVNLMEFCKDNNIKNFFYASSSSIYGNENKFSENTTQKNVSSIYAATKVCNEIFANVYNYHYEINTLGLRFFTVHGPLGREDMAYFKFLKQIKKDKKIKIYGDKNSIRSFTYVDDIVASIVRIQAIIPGQDHNWNETQQPANHSSAPYRIYNVVNGNPVKLLDFIEHLEQALGKKANKQLLPMQPGDVSSTYADVEDLIQNLDYKPSTTLEYGINKFTEWYRDFYKV